MLNGKSTVNIEKCMNEGKVILLNLPKGSGKFTSSVFGRLMIAYIHSIVLRRDGLPREKRKQIFFFIDEFQSYITQSLTNSLAESRKYGLGLVLASQSLKSISDTAMRKTIMVNTGLKAVSQTDYEDRNTFAKELGMKGEDLESLKPLQFYIKSDTGHTPFKVKVPFLIEENFLNTEKRKELLQYLAYRSGQYIKVISEPIHHTEKKESNTHSEIPNPKTDFKNKKDNPFDDGLKPAF